MTSLVALAGCADGLSVNAEEPAGVALSDLDQLHDALRVEWSATRDGQGRLALGGEPLPENWEGYVFVSLGQFPAQGQYGGLSRVTLRIDGVEYWTDTSAPYGDSNAPIELENGSHHAQAVLMFADGTTLITRLVFFDVGDLSPPPDEPGDEPDEPVAPGELRAEVQGATLTVWFPREVEQVRAQDFKVLGTHAKLEESRAPRVAGRKVEFTLDDSVLPDDRVVLDYFQPSGTLRDKGQGKRASFQQPVDNITAAYEGSKRVVRVASGGDIAGEIKADTIVALQRGGAFEGTVRIDDDRVVLSAYGQGAAPQLTASSGGDCLRIEADHVRIANLHLRGNNGSCIRYMGTSSFGLVTSNRITSVRPRADASALMLHKGEPRRAKNQYPEGNWALNNVIRDYEDGITSKFEPANRNASSPDYKPTLERELGGNRTPFRVELNDIEGISIDAIGEGEGDGIQVCRGGYYGSVIRRNTITGWGDDGIDMFGARDLVVEYNVLDNTLGGIHNGGNAIKMGGDGGAIRSISGRNIVRYNVINRTQRRRRDGSISGNGIGLSTNGGGSAGLSRVYGNLVLASQGHGLQLDGADGADWEIVHNTLFSVGGDRAGIANWRSRNLGALTFKNNVYNTKDSRFPAPGASNIRVAGASSVYTDPSSPLTTTVKAGSPTIGKGVEAGYAADRFGQANLSGDAGEMMSGR